VTPVPRPASHFGVGDYGWPGRRGVARECRRQRHRADHHVGDVRGKADA
jgi:hypothetical protein